jgi:hypothetical protein
MKRKTYAVSLGMGLGALLAILVGVGVFLLQVRNVLSAMVAFVLVFLMYLPQTPIETDPLIRLLTLGIFSLLWGLFVVLPMSILGGILGRLLGA